MTEADFKLINEKYAGENIDKMFAAGLMTHPSQISGSRHHMVSTQIPQSVMLIEPETPKCFTGWEKTVGKYSDGYLQSDSDYEIVAKIHRFSNFPNQIYLLVLRKKNTNRYDVVKVSHYENMSDNHGYMRPFTYMDDKGVGSTIFKDEVIYKPNTLDDMLNYRIGKNIYTAYISDSRNEEDAFLISESLAEETTFNLISKSEFTINKNDILLNIYGNNNEYKCMPMVGESVSDMGILFASRNIDKKNLASDLTDSALSHIYYGDNKFVGRGQIVDIDIKVNDLEELKSDAHRDQLYEIYNEQFRFNQEIYNVLSAIVKDPKNSVSYKLDQELFNATNYINPKINYSSNSGKFEFAYITVYCSSETTLKIGYKATNMDGGKGVIGSIVPDHMMPVDEHGTRAQIVISTPSIISRANIAQCYEQSFNYCSDYIVRAMRKMKNKEDQIKYMISYVTCTNKEYGDHIANSIKLMNKEEKDQMLMDIFQNGIYLYNPPFHNALGLKKLKEIKKRFKIKTSYIRMKREYKVSKDVANLYMDPVTIRSLHTLKDDYIWNNVKGNETFDTAEYHNIKDVKNPLKMKKKDYDNNKWTDDYVWNKNITTIDSKSVDTTIDDLLSGMCKLNEMFENEDISIKDFNSYDTKIYKKDDTTLIREFRSHQKIIIGQVYYIILKHIPDNNFSARSLGNTTPLGIPNKCFDKVESGRPFSQTCNKFGSMETSALKRRCSSEMVSRFLATSSTHPELREKLAAILLFEDPLKLHNIPIVTSEIKDTIPAKMLKAYLGVLGLCILDDDEKDYFDFLDNIDYKSVDDLFKNDLPIEEEKTNEGK